MALSSITNADGSLFRQGTYNLTVVKTEELRQFDPMAPIIVDNLDGDGVASIGAFANVGTGELRDLPGNPCIQLAGGNTTILGDLSITGTVSYTRGIGSYYKSSNQLASTGATDITWDSSEVWTDTGFIDPFSSTQFVCNTAGVYQLTAHCFIQANSQTWVSGNGSVFSIRVTRPPSMIESIFTGVSTPNSGANYSNFTTGILRLEVGDIITIAIFKTLTSGGQVIIQGTSPNIDRNTMFQFNLLG